MDIISNKIKQLEELKNACSDFENAINTCKNTLVAACNSFDKVEGKTLKAMAGEYRKRCEKAIKVLDDTYNKKGVKGNETL